MTEQPHENQEPENKTNDLSHPWEEKLASYPLRQPEEDPGWAIKIIKLWFGFALASGAFILILIVLGFFYD